LFPDVGLTACGCWRKSEHLQRLEVIELSRDPFKRFWLKASCHVCRVQIRCCHDQNFTWLAKQQQNAACTGVCVGDVVDQFEFGWRRCWRVPVTKHLKFLPSRKRSRHVEISRRRIELVVFAHHANDCSNLPPSVSLGIAKESSDDE